MTSYTDINYAHLEPQHFQFASEDTREEIN